MTNQPDPFILRGHDAITYARAWGLLLCHTPSIVAAHASGQIGYIDPDDARRYSPAHLWLSTPVAHGIADAACHFEDGAWPDPEAALAHIMDVKCLRDTAPGVVLQEEMGIEWIATQILLSSLSLTPRVLGPSDYAAAFASEGAAWCDLYTNAYLGELERLANRAIAERDMLPLYNALPAS